MEGWDRPFFLHIIRGHHVLRRGTGPLGVLNGVGFHVWVADVGKCYIVLLLSRLVWVLLLRNWRHRLFETSRCSGPYSTSLCINYFNSRIDSQNIVECLGEANLRTHSRIQIPRKVIQWYFIVDYPYVDQGWSFVLQAGGKF